MFSEYSQWTKITSSQLQPSRFSWGEGGWFSISSIELQSKLQSTVTATAPRAGPLSQNLQSIILQTMTSSLDLVLPVTWDPWWRAPWQQTSINTSSNFLLHRCLPLQTSNQNFKNCKTWLALALLCFGSPGTCLLCTWHISPLTCWYSNHWHSPTSNQQPPSRQGGPSSLLPQLW